VGCDASNKLLYASLEEQRRDFGCDLTLDFQDFTEYDNFISNAQRNVILEIPSAAPGRRLTLGSGRIINPPVEVAEIDLLALKLTMNFATLTIAAIT
jgi:hypothetical protein